MRKPESCLISVDRLKSFILIDKENGQEAQNEGDGELYTTSRTHSSLLLGVLTVVMI